MEGLERLRRAEAEVARELSRLLAPAGLSVRDVAGEGRGWRLHVEALDVSVDGHAVAAPVRGAASLAPARANLTAGVVPLVRRPGETLMELVGRADDALRVRGPGGAGGIRIEAPAAAVHAVWLAGTLVGDAILALRHLGEPEDGERAMEDLHRQLRVFRQESRRLLGHDDDTPFLVALDGWTPAGFPRGPAFLARGGEAVHDA